MHRIGGSVGTARRSGSLPVSPGNLGNAGLHIYAGIAADIVAINLAGTSMHICSYVALGCSRRSCTRRSRSHNALNTLHLVVE